MAEIKTRDVVKGTIKTVDRSAMEGHRIKNRAGDLRDVTAKGIRTSDETEGTVNEYMVERSQDQIKRKLGTAGRMTAKASEKAGVKSTDAIKNHIEKRKLDKEIKNAEAAARAEERSVYAVVSKARTVAASEQIARFKTAEAVKSITEDSRAMFMVDNTVAGISSIGRKLGEGRIKYVADSIAKSARALAVNTKRLTSALVAGGSIVAVVVVLCIIFCSAFCVFEESDGKLQVYTEEQMSMYDDGGIIGSNDIVEVAGKQLGNIGGYKFWHWYGFDHHVAWCACFVSWCADQCGYIDDGVCPKFSLVADGADWFKDKGRFKSRKYKPVAGDIIFFDWYDDGGWDHVGIVEKSDDRYVYTIEGNSHNICRKKTYPLGWYEIAGYGVMKIQDDYKKKDKSAKN